MVPTIRLHIEGIVWSHGTATLQSARTEGSVGALGHLHFRVSALRGPLGHISHNEAWEGSCMWSLIEGVLIGVQMQ